jgi:hypothetical protein
MTPSNPDCAHELPTRVTTITLGYRALRRPWPPEPGKVDFALRRCGQPAVANSELCHGRARTRIEQAAGLKVFDNRKAAG